LLNRERNYSVIERECLDGKNKNKKYMYW
jgi:hypothetical protein